MQHTRDHNSCLTPLRLCALLALIATSSVPARAAPRISNLSVHGLQIGGTTEITIQGSELLPDPQLVIGLPIAQQVVLENSTPSNLRLQVTLDDDVTAGLYNLRVANPSGISENHIVAVDKLPEAALAAQTPSLPIALHGTLTGSNVARTSFSGRAGQKLIVEVEAQRLGGKLRPVLHLYDARRRQVALAMPAPWLAGDARLVATLPGDGAYTIELHDLQYAGQNPAHFRLKIGQFQYADTVFPPVVQRGTTTALQLVGNVPADQQVEFTAAGPRPGAAPWPRLTLATGWRPRVLVSDLPELLESPPPEGPQQLPGVPVAVSGRLDEPGQQDVYRLAVSEGAKLRFEVFGDRLGAPIDPVLEIRNDQGGRLAQNDDADGTADPRIDYTVAKGVGTIDVVVSDQVDCGDQRCIYRLVVTPLEARQPAFRLTVTADTYNVGQGASRVFQVRSHRDGYDGPIQLTLENVPSSITASAVQIPAGCDAALMTLTGFGAETSHVVTAIRGTSVGIEPPVTALAEFEQHPLAQTQPWMKHDLALALAPANSAAFEIAWAQPPSATQLALGTTLKAPVRFTRPAGAIGPVRLSLLVSQPVPLVNNRPDANRAVRAQQATVDIAVDPQAKAAVDALAAAEKTLAESTAKIETTREGQAKTVVGAEAVVKAAADKKVHAEKAATAAQAAVKAAEEVRGQAAKVLEDAKAAAAAAADEDAKAAAGVKVDEAAKALADAEKTFADAVTKADAAKTAVEAAGKEHTDAEAKLAAAVAAAEKANADAQAAAQDAQAKRDEAENSLRTAEANIPQVAEFNVLVPPNLDISSCDLAIRAELRSIDNKNLLAEVFTPVRRFTPLHPLALNLSGDRKLAVKLDAKDGAVVKLKGTIERKAGFAGDVTVSISGQPGGVAVPKVVLKPDQSDYELEVKFPANFKPAEVKSIKLFASGPPNPGQANIVVRTEIPLTINVLAADPAEKNE